MRALVLTAAAMIAFAANSLLCRAALQPRLIDPASFTWIRIASGAAMLWILLLVSGRARPSGGTVAAALALFSYAAAFSFAYVRIGASVGVLLLFGAVQSTMVGWAALRGERPKASQLLGIVVALAGIAALTAPRGAAPDTFGSALMLVAGVAWGAYSLRGRSSRDPLSTTAHNFLMAVPLAAMLGLLGAPAASLTPVGVLLAATSGAIASGAGYAVWYSVLPSLGATRAAAVQLMVPVITGAGAMVLLGERLTVRIAVAALTIVAGVALASRGEPSRRGAPSAALTPGPRP
jgi:drug/metabolite transporter (DMT)-like permease